MTARAPKPSGARRIAPLVARLALGSALGAVVVVLLLRGSRAQDIIDVLAAASIPKVLVGLGVLSVANVIRAQRLVLLTNGSIGLLPAYTVTTTYNLTTALLPGGLGELYLPYGLAKRHSVQTADGVSLLLVTRLLDLGGLAVVVAAGGILGSALRSQRILALALSGLALVAFILGLRYFDAILGVLGRGLGRARALRRIGESVLMVADSVERVRGMVTPLVMLATAGMWALVVVAEFALMRALAIPLTIPEVCIALGIVFSLSVLPLRSFAGFGLHDSAWVLAFVATVHASRAHAIPDAFALHLLTLSVLVAIWITGLIADASGFRKRAQTLVLREEHTRRVIDGAVAGAHLPAAAPILVLIPSYNEALNIGAVLDRIPATVSGVGVSTLVIIDGSTDDTAEVVAGYPVGRARLSENLGGGAALRAGYAIAARMRADIVVTLDADGQHDPREMARLVEPILRDEADCVVGSRVLGSYEAPPMLKSIGVRAFSAIVSRIGGTRITDCSSGYRALRVSGIAAMTLRQNQYYAAEALIEAVRSGMRVREVPITISPRSIGRSRKGPVYRYAFGFARAVVSTAWRGSRRSEPAPIGSSTG